MANWWRHANEGTRGTARAADYYAAAPLPPGLVASLSLAGVEVVDAHLVPPEGGRRGYYLRRQDSETLRALDAASHRG